MYHFLKIYNLYWLFSNLSRHSTKLKIAQIFFFLSIKLNQSNDSFNSSTKIFANPSNLLRITISLRTNAFTKGIRSKNWDIFDDWAWKIRKGKKFPFLVNLFVVDSNRINDENSPWPLEGVRWKRRKEKKKRKARRGEKKGGKKGRGGLRGKKKRERERRVHWIRRESITGATQWAVTIYKLQRNGGGTRASRDTALKITCSAWAHNLV